MNDLRARAADPFLLHYQASDLRIASEFLTTWLPFLSRGLCHHCTQILSDRVRSLDPGSNSSQQILSDRVRSLDPELDRDEPTLTAPTPNNMELNDNNDDCDTNSLGSWKDGANGWLETVPDASTSETAPVETPRVRMSWADMAQEDEFEAEEEYETNKPLVDGNASSGEVAGVLKVGQKPELSRERREYIRFMNVRRKKDYICLERVKGKIVNILDGLELHTGVFSAAEQKRIVDFIYDLREMGMNGELKERTYSAPQKWMRGKGRVTIQFGCCYNYAMDKNGNPPGILQNDIVDPIPHLFKVIIRRLVSWHVLPPSCVPDSCIVNIYEEGDCIPPHIDNHDFVRPFCTVSFLSECDIVFGSNLKIVAAGEFSGSYKIPLPVGSVLVLNGNGADIAKHCVPAVPSKRISITFRKMDESKRPIGFVPEPDLQGIQQLSYEADRSKRLTPSKPQHRANRQAVRRDGNIEEARNSAERGDTHSEPRYSGWSRRGPAYGRRVRVNLDS